MHSVARCPFYSYCFHMENSPQLLQNGEQITFLLVLEFKTRQRYPLVPKMVHFYLSHLLHLCRLRINCCCSDLVEITFKLPEAVANQMDQVCISLIPRQP